MPDYVLIAVAALVPILALTLALACGQAPESADVSDGLADDANGCTSLGHFGSWSQSADAQRLPKWHPPAEV